MRLEPMRNAYSYEGILSAVGRVLDQAGVKRIAIQDTGDGLIVDGFDTAGESPISLQFDIPQLYGLLAADDGATSRRMPARDEGTLRHFLERHELVGAR
ncbi:MAG: hypothetical protein PVSMB4_18250 [Ktedonobacterales bacterium]